MNLREDKGWSYGAFSAIVGARGERPLLVYAPVQTDKTADSITEIRNELTAFVGDEPPTAEELDLVKDSQTLSLPGRWEASGDVLRSLGELVRYGLPDDYWSTFAARIKALDLDDVAAVARAVVKPDDMAWVVVGDRTKIEAELSGLGFEEIRLIDSEGRPAGMD
jgi:zinc protease